MYCKNCGMIISDGAKYCKRCGAPIQSSQTSAQRETKKKSRAWVPVVIILMAAVIGVLAFFLIRNRRQPELAAASQVEAPQVLEPAVTAAAPAATLQRLEEALDDLNIDRAVECFDQSSREAVRKYLTESLLEGVSDLTGFFSDAVDFDFEIIDVQFSDEEHCMVTMDGAYDIDIFGYTQSGAQRLDIPMVCENGEWYVTGTALFDLF